MSYLREVKLRDLLDADKVMSCAQGASGDRFMYGGLFQRQDVKERANMGS